MPDTSSSDTEKASPTTAATPVNGVNLDAQRDVNIGGDLVGRDKVINVAPGATLILGDHPAAKEKELPPSVLKRQHFEPEMLLVSAGSFLMGSQPGPGAKQAELPQHVVTLPAYYMGKYPITNREYAEFIKQDKEQKAPQAGWSGRKPPADKLDHPVVNVSWVDAAAYCRWLSQQTRRVYRLPSEAEWEKTARGTDGRIYPWGNDWMDNVCNSGAGGNGDTMSVKAHVAGASPFGCQDMLGNVEEWTNTLWSTNDSETYLYPYQPDDGREDPDENQDLYRPQRVHRGGSYRDIPRDLRCSARGYSSQLIAVKWRGFRVLLEA